MSYEKPEWLEIVRAAAQEWSLIPTDINLVSLSENLVYRIDTEDQGTYALRLHRPGYHTFAELESEQHWTIALNEAGINVPIGVPLADGSYYTSSHLPNSEKRYVGLVDWLPGKPLWDLLETAGSFEAIAGHYQTLGRLTAMMHEQASNWSLPQGFTRHHLDAEGFMGDEPFWGPFWDLPELGDDQQRLILRARDTVHKQLAKLPKTSDSYTIIHADLHAGNLLVDEASSTSTVIDFDDCGFGWHIYDMAVTLFYAREFKAYPYCYDGYVDGYREVRQLTDDTLELLPLFTLIRGLAILGWIHHRREVDRSESLQKMIADVTQGCERLLRA